MLLNAVEVQITFIHWSLSHKAMHALNGNSSSHPKIISFTTQQPTIENPPAEHIPIVTNTPAPTKKSNTIESFTTKLQNTKSDAIPRLIQPKPTKKGPRSKEAQIQDTNANFVTISLNMDRGGPKVLAEWVRLFRKQFPNRQLVIGFQETGIQTEEEVKAAKKACEELGFQSEHVFVPKEESNLILKQRMKKENKTKEEIKLQTATPRRGGVSAVWSEPLTNPKITRDPLHHWLKLEFTHNKNKIDIIVLYNNNTTPESNHPYDEHTGNTIITKQIIPILTDNTFLLMDANQTLDDTRFRSPKKKSHTFTAVSTLHNHGLTDAATHINRKARYTYQKNTKSGPTKAVIDFVQIPTTLEKNLLDAGTLLSLIHI